MARQTIDNSSKQYCNYQAKNMVSIGILFLYCLVDMSVSMF